MSGIGPGVAVRIALVEQRVDRAGIGRTKPADPVLGGLLGRRRAGPQVVPVRRRPIPVDGDSAELAGAAVRQHGPQPTRRKK
jgi:hypothetical protein